MNVESAKPLRILIVLNLPWDDRLGAVRVYVDLANQWRADGHTVEHYSLSEAFPDSEGSGPQFALRQLHFASKAKHFVKANSTRFDVVDALIGSLPASRQQLGFNGKIVARSVGLYLPYGRFEKEAAARWRPCVRGKLLGRIFYKFVHSRMNRASEKSVRTADLINVPNEEEAQCLRTEIGPALPILVEPYAIALENRKALAAAAAAKRLAAKKISFIGMWSPRKGSHDWPEIVRAVWRKIPEARFLFLGTMVEPEIVLRDLSVQFSDRIELVSKYLPVDLPLLLADSTVGAFPSYSEGFGLAVLEQLAAGIPTIAYNVAGPRDILGPELRELLVPCGDAAAFADGICRLLEMNPAQYEKLSRRCVQRASEFDWQEIARDTIAAYRLR